MDRVDITQPPLALLHNLRVEAAVPIPGTAMSTGPAVSVITVLDRSPFRESEEPRRGQHLLPGLRRPKGMPDSVNTIYPATIVQTCIVHLIRSTFKFASKKYWAELAKDVKAIYPPPTPPRLGVRSRRSRRNAGNGIRRSAGSGGMRGPVRSVS
jgi:Transposase, Mutator family